MYIMHTDKGYITCEQTGKSQSYIVWLHEGTYARKIATIGIRMANALTKALAKLEEAN